MKRFMEVSALIEPSLKLAEPLFNEGNRLDLSSGGEDWELEDIFLVLESYVAKASIEQGELFLPSNMKAFIEKVWDALWMMSSFSKATLEKWLILNQNYGFIKIRLENRNYAKQLWLIKIVNEICSQTYGFNLAVIL